MGFFDSKKSQIPFWKYWQKDLCKICDLKSHFTFLMLKRAAAFSYEMLLKVTVSSFLFNHHNCKCFQTYIFIFEPCKVNNASCCFKARLTAFAQEHRRNDVSTFIPSPFLSSRSRSALHLCLYYLFFRIPPSASPHIILSLCCLLLHQ